MRKIVTFNLISMVNSTDKTGQTKATPTPSADLIGQVKSVSQNEFYKADQAGLRPQGVIEMSAFDYSNQTELKIGDDTFVIYRTYMPGTDRIELYYGERIGKNG